MSASLLSANLRYLRTVLKHKWYVLKYGWGTVPLWRLLTHDLSKFGRAEWPAYVARFASGRAGKEDKELDPTAFKDAWEHHWENNPHHWEYWVEWMADVAGSEPGVTCYEMPETYVYEMVADWKAASKAYSGKDNCWAWYEAHRGKQAMHPNTRALVERLLRRGIQEDKAKRMVCGERICMVLDCDGKLANSPELGMGAFMYVCQDCGVAQRKENVLFLRQYDRENAYKLAMR